MNNERVFRCLLFASLIILIMSWATNCYGSAVVFVTPEKGPQGSNLDVEIHGTNTNWTIDSRIWFEGPRIICAIRSLPINSNLITANITIPIDADTGFYDLSVKTDLGDGNMEIDMAPSAFEVVTPSGIPEIISVVPSRGGKGETLDLYITGKNTNFVNGVSVADFGPRITVINTKAVSSTTAVATIAIDEAASIGPRDCIVRTGTEVADESLDGPFWVSLPAPPTPQITAVTPSEGFQGQTLAVRITGENSPFVDGISMAGFSGAGITVLKTIVYSANSSQANIRIAADASVGFRHVYVRTGNEVATAANAFQVKEGEVSVPATIKRSTIVDKFDSTEADESEITLPNIVLLYADDLGWTDLGCYGSKYYETPNMDRLRNEGMRFTDAYSDGAMCAPSRASLMIGKYTPRHGVYATVAVTKFDNDPCFLKYNERKLLAMENERGISTDEITIAEALKTAGYTTAVFGKWNLGKNKPKAHGFDESIITSTGSHWDFETDPPMQIDPGTYLSDFITDCALEFIEKNKHRPFFLYLPDYLVHAPLEAKEELVAKYRNKPPAGRHHNPKFAAMIESLDYSVGRVLRKLDELGIADNTLVVFTSDNGGRSSFRHSGLHLDGVVSSNAPLRGQKAMLYEGGIRVPLIVRWPTVVEPGSTCDEPVIGMDLFPTFLEAAHVPNLGELDGESLVSILSGQKTRLERNCIFWHFPAYYPPFQRPAGAIRCRDFKLIKSFEDGRIELFDLKDDVGERNDLSAKMPVVVEELHEKLKMWHESTKAPMPDINPNFKREHEWVW